MPTISRASKDTVDADMTKAPPAEQAMHRNRDRDAEGIGGNLKLDASEFDGCWLVIPDHDCKFCCDTRILAQKHVDADTIVSKSVEFSVLSACLPCFCPFLAWVCCPTVSLGLRVSDAGDKGKNSFDYIEDLDGAQFPDPNELSEFSDVPQYFLKPYDKYYAPGFEWLGHSCDKSRKTVLNGDNKTWQYSGASKATLRPWNHQYLDPMMEFAPEGLFPEAEAWIAVRCAPACCMPTSFNRHRQLLAAYFSGSRRKDDRPLTAVEQDDKEVCAATFAGALEVGNTPLLRRYRPVVGALKPEHALVLAGNGHLEALKWARDEGVEFPPDICLAAASSGKVDVLEYCKENGATCDDEVMTNAMKSGSVECVEYCLKTLKLRWGEKSIPLASKISPEMLKYCLDNGAPADDVSLWSATIYSACKNVNIEIVKILAESSHPFPRGPFKVELFRYQRRKILCDKIERMCARKGLSLKYTQIVNDSD